MSQRKDGPYSIAIAENEITIGLSSLIKYEGVFVVCFLTLHSNSFFFFCILTLKLKELSK